MIIKNSKEERPVMTAKTQLKILVLNGPNLNLLGSREPDIYGQETLDDIQALTNERAGKIATARDISIDLDFRQSNSESDLISWIGDTPGSFDGIIINPAAFTHTSVGVLDAIKAVDTPCVEVHLSNTHAREDFRQKSITAAGCVGQVMGFQSRSYLLALEGLVDYILKARAS
jgi:3-dehydroquinate dehydratase-2